MPQWQFLSVVRLGGASTSDIPCMPPILSSFLGRRPKIGTLFRSHAIFYASNTICASAQAFPFPITGEEDKLQHTACFRLGCCCHCTASHTALHIGHAMCSLHLSASSRRCPRYDSSSLCIALGRLTAKAHMLGIGESVRSTRHGLSWQHVFQVSAPMIALNFLWQRSILIPDHR